MRGRGQPQLKDPRRALVVAILGSTMAFLDGTVVNVALPVMQRELRATSAQMQWVVEAYALFLAALVLVGGALGDRYGRRRVFLVGVVAFAGASMACGFAPGVTPLVVARAVQGVGAALLVPGSLALISAAYPEKERGAAIGKWSSASAITAAIGPVVGGFIVMHASWRWIFFLNAPVAAVVLALSAGVDETRDDEAPHRLDLAGATLAILGLGAIVYALLGSAAAGGLSRPAVLAPLIGGVLLLCAFVFVEARVAHPMLPLSLFGNRAFAVTNVLTFLLYAALGGALFFLPFELLQVQHYSPAKAGISLLPFIVLVSLMSPWAGGLAARRGPRLPLVLGPSLAAVGFALLAVPAIGGSYFTTFFPGIVVLGVGMGLTVAPLTMVVMTAVETRHAGLASGVNNAVSRTAGLLAVAGLGVVLAARFDHALDRALAAVPLSESARAIVDAQRARLAGADLSALDPTLRAVTQRAFDEAFVTAFRTTTLVGAVLAALAALSALFLAKKGPRPLNDLAEAVPPKIHPMSR